MRDQVEILFCDFELDVDNREDKEGLSAYLADVRLLMEILGEEDVWITYHSVERII